jgi:hypothetical protein
MEISISKKGGGIAEVPEIQKQKIKLLCKKKTRTWD